MNALKNDGSHELYHQQLISYLYGEMTPEETTGFERHLGACSDCDRDVQEFRQVRGVLADWTIEDSPGIVLRLQPTLGQSFRQLVRVMPLWLRIASVGAVAVLLMAISNLRVSFGAGTGFQIQAGLRPTAPLAGKRVDEGSLSQQQVQNLIEVAVRQEQARREAEMQARLTSLAEEIRTERERQLAQFGKTVRGEQRRSLQTVWNEMDRRSRPTFASLFLESDNGTND